MELTWILHDTFLSEIVHPATEKYQVRWGLYVCWRLPIQTGIRFWYWNAGCYLFDAFLQPPQIFAISKQKQTIKNTQKLP